MEVTLLRVNIDDAKELYAMQVDAFKELLEKYQDFDTNPANESMENVEARYFKQDKKGVATMCKIMEDMRNEKAKEVRIDNALRMIKDGELSLEKIALYSGLSIDEVKELATPVMA